MTDPTKTTLVYDGDCSICQEWVNHWQVLTNNEVQFEPYQSAKHRFPQISEQEFRRSIQLIDSDGGVASGAEATFRLYRNIFPYSLLIFLYRHFPGFGSTSEYFYTFFSKRRGLLAFISHLFWGRNFQPSDYIVVTRIFLGFLGLIYFSAFFSFLIQAQGLIGSDGVLPLHYFVARLTELFGETAWLNAPMWFWLSTSDAMIQWVSASGCVLSLLVIFSRFVTPALILLFFSYLSLYYAGQVFMSFQWDILLLEAGFLAIFLGKGSRIIVWLYRWLLFRFMLLGGLVKLASRDPTWDNLTALTFHFETQPLPTPLAWYVHQWPEMILMAMVALTFIIELLVPFLIFAPRRIRFIAAWCFIIFQSGIILTGNYNFFNLLAIAFCLFLFDDRAILHVLPTRLSSRLLTSRHLPRQYETHLSTKMFLRSFLLVIILFVSTEKLLTFIQSNRSNEPSLLSRLVAPLNIVNNYGPFAVMTTVRHEVTVEGSNDGINWFEYSFHHKPDRLDKPLRWIIPHQPRLDWQMWFAALSNAERQVWFRRLLYQCLDGSPAVLDLFAHNPFPNTPPTFMRARFFEYTFTDREQREKTGNIWQRDYVKDYLPALRLRKTE